MRADGGTRTGVRTALVLLATCIVALPVRSAAQLSTRAMDPVARRGTPEWVVEMFYARPEFPDKARHITGEFASGYANAPTMGSRLPRTVAVTSRALREARDSAVYATSLREGQHSQDWYTFLRREHGVWKIESVRTLSLPPVHHLLLDSLERRHARGTLADSLRYTMEVMRLAVRSDSALKRHLLANESSLRALAVRFAAMRELNAASASGESSPPGAVGESERRGLMSELRSARLGAVMRFEDRPHCVFLKIGGSTDNTVGFLHAPPGCAAPPLSAFDFIYIEAVAPGWFLYKTT